MNNEAINNRISCEADSENAVASESNRERKKGTVKKFSSLSLSSLNTMRTDLELEMGVGELAKCQSMYRLLKREDVSTDEIYFLDSYVCARKYLPSAIAPRELLTNDKYIAETYADMMKKCSDLEIFGTSVASINIENLFGVGGRYAKYAGRNSGYFISDATREFSNIIGDSAVEIAPAAKNEPQKLTNVSSGKHCFISDSATEIRFGKRSLKKKTSIAVLIPKENGVSASARMHQLFSDKSLSRAILGYRVVSDCLTKTFSDMFGNYGIKVNVNALYDLGIKEAYELENSLFGCPIIAYSSKREQDIIKLSESLAIKALPFASVQKVYNLTLCKDNATVFNVPLRYLSFIHPAKASVAEIEDNRFILESFSPSFISSSSTPDGECEVVKVRDKLFASSVSASMENKYFSTLYSLLGAVSKLIASGVALSDVSVSYELEASYPNDEKSLGDLLSSILGLYRAHAELALPSSKTTIKLSKEKKNDCFTAFAFGENHGEVTPNVIYQSDRICTYIAEPDLNSDGIVDFAALRDILAFLTNKEHRIISARVICAERPFNILGEKFVSGEYDLSEKKTLAFIIQCAEEISVPHSRLLEIVENRAEV